MSRASDALFSQLATHYDEHFEVPHRRAYDHLAWELTCAHLPRTSATVIDVGCGVGRWAERLIARGHEVIGVEPAQLMVKEARRRVPGMQLHQSHAESVQLPDESADLIVAMGSIQYADDPEQAMRNVAGWLKPGGHACVLVDSRVALAVELTAAGRWTEAVKRLQTGQGQWVVDGLSAALTLYDAAELSDTLRHVGLEVVSVHGLLVGHTVWGREGLARRLNRDWTEQLRIERDLAAQRPLADLGKQLLCVARRPVQT